MAASDDWSLYAAHRERLTEVISSSASGAGGKLCLLGAGRCNDVDLARLAQTFSEIHLVDIDAKALDEASSRQSPAVRSRLVVHGKVDIAGLTPKRLRKWKGQPPSPREVESWAIATLEWLLARLPGPFDVVASTCVLTQLAFALRQTLGEQHRMLGAIRMQMVLTHLRCLVGLTRPGGASIFACDLASSSHFPLDRLDTSASLFDVMAQIIERESYYASANPNLILELWQRDDLLRSCSHAPDLLEPWLWTGPEARTYLVYAIRALRRMAEG
jgi:hypothetical protein